VDREPKSLEPCAPPPEAEWAAWRETWGEALEGLGLRSAADFARFAERTAPGAGAGRVMAALAHVAGREAEGDATRVSLRHRLRWTLAQGVPPAAFARVRRAAAEAARRNGAAGGAGARTLQAEADRAERARRDAPAPGRLACPACGPLPGTPTRGEVERLGTNRYTSPKCPTCGAFLAWREE